MKLMNMTSTMTLKEITDLLEVRHNNAMRTVAEMAQDPDFGSVTQIEYRTKQGNCCANDVPRASGDEPNAT